MKNAFQIARNTFSEKYKGIYNKEPIEFIVWTKVDWKFEMDWQLLKFLMWMLNIRTFTYFVCY